MAQPIPLIIFFTIQDIIEDGSGFVQHSSYVQGQSVAGAGSKPQERKDQRVGMGGHMEGTSATEHTETQTPVDPEKRYHGCHFKSELCFITYKQSALFWGNFGPHIILFEV